jgi:uncharacterized protein DUF4345
MSLLWRLGPWPARLLLVFATALFFVIGLKYLCDPVDNAAADSIALGSVMAISRLRVGFGGFPLALSLILFGCLISARHLLSGLLMLATTVGVITIARLVGIAIDGSVAEALRLLSVETVLFALSVILIFVERARLRSLRWVQAAGNEVGEPT